MSELVRVDVSDHVAVVTIDRPKALNALNEAVLDGLNSAFDGLNSDTDVACVVLQGGGEKAFVAGADISAMHNMDAAGAVAFSQKGQAVFEKIERCPVPVIASVQGFALGGGCELVLCCDIVLASENARFGQPEVKLGLIPGFGGCVRLPRKIGPVAAAHWIYSGDVFPATDALRLGLVAATFPKEALRENTMKLAQTIAARGPLSVRAAKSVLIQTPHCPPQTGYTLESAQFAGLFHGGEMREGLGAFLEKRDPDFRKA